MPLTPGTRLGSFEIVAPLGAGGMGEVYRARDTRLGREVAIKVLSETFAASQERLGRFRREAQTLATLNHPNIAAVYGLEDVDGVPYLVLELVEGETLSARLSRGALPPRETLALGAQVAAAIEAAHAGDIVHRDLKPGNIMITRAGVAKVLDFGLAKTNPTLASASDSSQAATEQLGATAAGMILGTAAYMSPEQARGKPVDRRSDVWSFGCVLFECLAGRAAFTGETVSDLIARILALEPDWSALPAGTPPRLRELIRRCLRKDMEARPRDIRDVRLEMGEIATGGAANTATPEKSIAVLPFENLSSADDEYFADGVTDEIMNALSHLDGLRVAARTSCFAFKGRREDLRSIGEKLDVTTILEGTVRRAGPRLRITVQLVNAADGYQLWSERYDREMTDVFELQEEIATTIANRLWGTLRGESERGRARSGTKNLEAYELLLKGRALQNRRGRFLPEAIQCFEQAIALDPGYAEAIAWLSDSYRLMGTFGTAPSSEVMPKARALAERALAIDSGLVEAWATLASVEEQFEWNTERAFAMWERAIAVDPRHATSRCQRALYAYVRGFTPAAETIAETRRAVQDDPLSPWVRAMHSHLLGFVGRHEESIIEAERAIALDADSFLAQWNRMRSYAWAGRHQHAIDLASSVFGISGRHQWALGTLGWTYGKTGKPELARAVHDEMEARSRHEFLSPFWLAVAASSAGRLDRAIEHVERAVAEHDPLVSWGRVVPFWDIVRTHPRFTEVTRRVWEPPSP